MTAPPRVEGSLEALGLEVRHADRLAVEQLDLNVPAGTMLAVTGPSG